MEPRTFKECRIWKLLGAPVNRRSIPYVNHHGRHPHFCPQWTRMNIIERRMTALEAGFCLQCLDPEKYFTNGIDVAKHQQHKCILNTSRHNRTCSNKACLQHKWICRQHSKKNGPLLGADRLTLESYASRLPGHHLMRTMSDHRQPTRPLRGPPWTGRASKNHASLLFLV